MYRDRLAEPGESKLSARRHVGSLLDLNQATLRNWVEERYAPDGTRCGVILNRPDAITVRLNRRTYSPVLRQADLPDVAVPWWGGRRLHFEFE